MKKCTENKLDLFKSNELTEKQQLEVKGGEDIVTEDIIMD